MNKLKNSRKNASILNFSELLRLINSKFEINDLVEGKLEGEIFSIKKMKFGMFNSIKIDNQRANLILLRIIFRELRKDDSFYKDVDDAIFTFYFNRCVNPISIKWCTSYFNSYPMEFFKGVLKLKVIYTMKGKLHDLKFSINFKNRPMMRCFRDMIPLNVSLSGLYID